MVERRERKKRKKKSYEECDDFGLRRMKKKSFGFKKGDGVWEDEG